MASAKYAPTFRARWGQSGWTVQDSTSYLSFCSSLQYRPGSRPERGHYTFLRKEGDSDVGVNALQQPALPGTLSEPHSFHRCPACCCKKGCSWKRSSKNRSSRSWQPMRRGVLAIAADVVDMLSETCKLVAPFWRGSSPS